ncbi:MAG: DUF6065 family protein [Phycisphaerales bacterium JB059]
MPDHDTSQHPPVSLKAYQVGPNPGYVIEPSPARRQWMDEFPNRQPYRCLPLNLANQGGWLVRSPVTFSAKWNGKMEPAGLKITFEDDANADLLGKTISSHFGGGILTFALPWLFRTTEGYALWVHGPPNWPMDNLQALEGIVETDWLSMTFTMNWKIMRRNSPVWFRKGDPVCLLTPYPMHLLEAVKPEVVDVRNNPELHRQVVEATKSRAEIIQKNAETGGADWEKKYMRGVDAKGNPVGTHKTNFKLAPFTPGKR